MGWTQDKWISFIYTCNYLFCECSRISLTRNSEHTYHRRPSLRKSENNVLLLFTSSSTFHDQHLRVLSEWANSKNTFSLCQRLIEDFQNSQESEQLVLILTALLCHKRLLLYTSNDIVQPFNDCYLVDLDVLLNDKYLSNRRAVFERMKFSFLRILIILDDEYEDMTRLLAVVFDKDSSFLKSFDEVTDQYVAQRIKNRLPHLSARKKLKGLRLMETMLKLSMNVGSSFQSIDNISEDYWMIEFLGKSSEDIRQIISADTASLVEEFSWLDEDLETQWLSPSVKAFGAHREIWDGTGGGWCICAGLVWGQVL